MKKHGGPRSNAGRKPLPKSKKKICIQIYETGETVKKAGGLEKAKEAARKAVRGDG